MVKGLGCWGNRVTGETGRLVVKAGCPRWKGRKCGKNGRGCMENDVWGSRVTEEEGRRGGKETGCLGSKVTMGKG